MDVDRPRSNSRGFYFLLKTSITLLGVFALNSGKNSSNWPLSLQVRFLAVLTCLFRDFYFVLVLDDGYIFYFQVAFSLILCAFALLM